METKQLIIGRISTPNNFTAEQIPGLLKEAGISYIKVENVNWPIEYPYQPAMEVGIAHTGKEILIHYRVKEKSVRAVATKDQDHIWEDSCAEFFCCPNGEGEYYNFECNCTGKLLLAVGPGRSNREPAPDEVMQTIKRWASLGASPFDVRTEETAWELALSIPTTAFFKHNIMTLNGLQATCNIYKCGDKLPEPHFISWKPIATENPDFHRPEYFGLLEFA